MTYAASSARFVVRGTHPTTIDVFGVLDGPAAVGLEAVVDALLREREVVINLRRTTAVDPHGWNMVDTAAERIRAVGGTVCVRPPLTLEVAG